MRSTATLSTLPQVLRHSAVNLEMGDTPPADALAQGVNTMIGAMAANSSAVKRNRLPAGIKGAKPELVFDPETVEAYRAAARASGNLSMSLYLELLRRRFEAEYGTLPILDERVELPIPAA